TNSGQVVNLGQANSLYAALNGSSTQDFNALQFDAIQDITAPPSTYDFNEAVIFSTTVPTTGVSFSDMDGRLLAIGFGPNGPFIRTALDVNLDLSQNNGVIINNATWGNQPISLAQGNSLYAPISGNAATLFSAAPGTSGNEVVNYSQVPLGQSFHIVTSNRAYSTVYTNTSSRPLTVYFIGLVVTAAANATLQVLLNTLTVIELTRYSGNDSLVFDVPAGYTYEIINTQAGINMVQWAELY
ncbi:hypothetical protein, partial [Ferrovum sp.]|uniref:hypothetical protein n=1 Tax=Ferrovum sp. TaxID=2609467 RepID=UPI002624C937